MTNDFTNRDTIVTQQDMNANWQEKSLEELTVESCPTTVSSNEKVEKNKGVWYNARTRCWLACVRVNGRHLKVFSVKKYGFHKAKMMALQCKNEADLSSGSDSTQIMNPQNERRNESNSSTNTQSKNSEISNENDTRTYQMKEPLNENSSSTKIENGLTKQEETKETYEDFKEFEKIERTNSKDSNHSKHCGNSGFRKMKVFETNDLENNGRRYNTRRGNALAKIEEISMNQGSSKSGSIASSVNNSELINHSEQITFSDNLKSLKNMRSTFNAGVGYPNQANNNKINKIKKTIKNNISKNKRKSENEAIKERDRINKMEMLRGKSGNTNDSLKMKECILTDKDFQLDLHEKDNEEAYCFKPHVFEYTDTTHTKSKNTNLEGINSNVTFTDEHQTDNCSTTHMDDQDATFLDLTREALALILQDLRKNVVPRVPVGIERKERYVNSLSVCLKIAKVTQHFNELEPYLDLFSECIRSSKLPSHMDLQDQLFYLDQL